MDLHRNSQRKWSHREVAELLTSSTALTELGVDDALKIVQRMNTVEVAKGDVLVHEGTSSTNYMLLVLRGECVVEHESLKKSDSLILGIVGPGNIIGEMGVFDGEPRSATCKAFTDMDVAMLDRSALTDLLTQEPATGCKLLAALLHRTSGRLRATNKKLRLLTQVNRMLEYRIEAFTHPGARPQAVKPAAPADVNPSNPLMF